MVPCVFNSCIIKIQCHEFSESRRHWMPFWYWQDISCVQNNQGSVAGTSQKSAEGKWSGAAHGTKPSLLPWQKKREPRHHHFSSYSLPWLEHSSKDLGGGLLHLPFFTIFYHLCWHLYLFTIGHAIPVALIQLWWTKSFTWSQWIARWWICGRLFVYCAA